MLFMNKKKEHHDPEKGKEIKKPQREENEKVQSDTGKRPEKDTNPLPPNPNKVDDHEE